MSKGKTIHLPVGWSVDELQNERRYEYRDGVAMVREIKDAATFEMWVYDRANFSVQRDTSKGEASAYESLRDALRIAEEILEDPSKHLSDDGVQKVKAARLKYLASHKDRLDIERLNPAVLAALRELHNDVDIMFMSPREAFGEYCTWHGLINWGDTLWDRAKELMELRPATAAHQALPALSITPARGLTNSELAEMQGFGTSGSESQKVVVMMSGGVVQDILVSGQGLSVAVVEYDKNADLDDQIVVPDGDGEERYALASIREPILNPERVEELFSAVEEARPAVVQGLRHR